MTVPVRLKFFIERLRSEGSTLAGRFEWERVSDALPFKEACVAYARMTAQDATAAHRIVEQ